MIRDQRQLLRHPGQANNGNTDRGPVLKGERSTDQLIVGWCSSHGSPETMEWKGAALSPREKETGLSSQHENRNIHSSWINLAVAGFAMKRNTAIR